MNRPLCTVCNINNAAINYYSNNKVRYRSVCDACYRKKKKIKPSAPLWYKKGYRKKTACELCGYRAKYPTKQLSVFHVDGNEKNVDSFNLKTVCLNCKVELSMNKTRWQESPIIPDF
jgi:hypothetical protein